ncbi:hypothetical protein PABG_00414 [Paracoccidioides brasiliensis Pb03]|nr:hypothetical protein PABG_00414 [Paracoccidioides brasiliensis Pb03]
MSLDEIRGDMGVEGAGVGSGLLRQALVPPARVVRGYQGPRITVVNKESTNNVAYHGQYAQSGGLSTGEASSATVKVKTKMKIEDGYRRLRSIDNGH